MKSEPTPKILVPNQGKTVKAMLAIASLSNISPWERFALFRGLTVHTNPRAHCPNSGVPAARRDAKKRRALRARSPK